MKTAFFLFFLLILLSLNARAQQTFNKLNVKELNISKSLTVSSITDAAQPCPPMTEAQRDALTPDGPSRCVYNTDTSTLNVYNGSAWKSAGGGVNQWVTGNSYQVDDVVIESSKFYVALTAHTAGTFATDLVANEWEEVSGYIDTVGVDAKAQNGTVASSVQEIQVNHKSLTETDTGKHLINNCGSDSNRLENCGFEHSTTAQGYSTSLTGTASVTLSVDTPSYFTEGNKSVNIQCLGGASGGTCLFYQDVASMQIQGMVRGLFQSDSATGVKVYSRVDGVNNLSKDIQSTLAGPVPIPQVMGSTSTGIAIEITVAASQEINVKADSMFVGAQDVKQDVSTCNSIECETEFSAKVSATGVVSDENYDWINGNATPSVSQFPVVFNSGLFSTPPNCTISLTSLSASSYQAYLYVQATTTGTTIRTKLTTTGADSDQAFNIKCSRTGSDFANAKRLAGGSIYSSQNADTDWASCGHTTSDFTGFGTVSNIETQCKRQGGDLLMKGNFTPGTGTAVEARLALKFSGQSLTSKDTGVIPTVQIAGFMAKNGSSTTYFGNSVLMEPSVSYVTFGQQSSTADNLAKSTGSASFVSGVKQSFNAQIPIDGWENSNVIVGSFKEVVTSQGSNGVDIQSVYFGSSADCSTACTTGNCTICNQVGGKITSVSFVSTGNYNINGIDGTKYNCLGLGAAATIIPAVHIRTLSTTTYAYIRFLVSATPTNSALSTITCLGSE